MCKYSIIAKPLTAVLKKNGEGNRNSVFSKQEHLEITEAMKALKIALTSPPILAFADLHYDASDFFQPQESVYGKISNESMMKK